MRDTGSKNRKRILALVGLFILALSACSLSSGSRESTREYTAYYLNQDASQVQSERFEPLDEGTDALLAELVAIQKQMPKDGELNSLLPSGIEILDYELQDGTLTLNFSAAYAAMNPTREILARAGLVRTFVQVDDVRRVVFLVEGEPLLDGSGNEIGPLTAGSFVENAGKEINSYQRTTLTLYFTDEQGEVLLAERRAVYYSSNEPLERVIVEELIKGPEEAGHYAVIATDASVLSVTSQDQICYVNFESSFSGAPLAASEEVQVWAIVNSLIENCAVTRVQFTIGGENNVVFREEIPLDQSFEMNTELIREG